MLTLAQLHAELKPISSGSSKSSRTFTNWASTYQSLTTQIFQPKTIQQVQLIVQLARKEGKNLRVSGSGHSPSDLVCTNDFIINLDKMQKVLRVSSNSSFVRCKKWILFCGEFCSVINRFEE